MFRYIRLCKTTVRRRYSVDALRGSFQPGLRMERSVSEFDMLLHHRSSANLTEVLALLADMHDIGVRVPLEYYRCSIDVCAHQCDINSMEIMLSLARKNFDRDSSGSRPFNSLLAFAVSKFSRYGNSSHAFQLWQSFLREGEGLQKDLLSSITNKMFTKTRKNPIAIYNNLMDRISLNVWNENYMHCSSTIANMREYLLRWSSTARCSEHPSVYSSSVLNESVDFTAHMENMCRSIPRVGSDMIALRIQQEVAFCLSHRISNRQDEMPLDVTSHVNVLYETAKLDFHNMLTRIVAEKEGTLIDSKKCSEQLASPLHSHSQTECRLMRVINKELQSLTSYEADNRRTHMYQELLRLHRSMLEHSPPHGGADPGANYIMNRGRENVRTSILLFLEEMSHRETFEDIISIVKNLLSACSTRHVTVPSGTGAVLLPCSSYDDAINPLKPVQAADSRSPFSPLRQSHSKRSVPPARASEQYFVQLMFNMVMKNCKNSPSLTTSGGHVATGMAEYIDDENGWVLYEAVGRFAWNLKSLATSHGVGLNSDFFAYWIMSLPLMKSTSTEHGWQKSLKHVMRIKMTLVHQHLINEHDSAVTNAVVSHLCQYKTSEAINYATHLIQQDMGKGIVPSPDTWNVLLSSCVSVGHKRVVRLVLAKVLETCSSVVRIEDAAFADGNRYDSDGTWVEDMLSQQTYASALNTKNYPFRRGEYDVGLTRAVFHAHLLLGHGFEALRTVKLLRACGAIITRNEYNSFVKCMTRRVSHPHPLMFHLCCRPNQMSRFLLHEMKKDGALGSSVIVDMLELFLRATALACPNRQVDTYLSQVALDAQSFCEQSSGDYGISMSSDVVIKLVEIYCRCNMYEEGLDAALHLCSKYDLEASADMFLGIQKHCILSSTNISQHEKILNTLNSHNIAIPTSILEVLLARLCEECDDMDMKKLWYLYRMFEVTPGQQNLYDGLAALLDNGKQNVANQLAEYIIAAGVPDDERPIVASKVKSLFKRSGFENNM